jgi:F-type H+-transporting ATPase subunit b
MAFSSLPFQIQMNTGNFSFFSFFVNNEESFLEFNSNILETNLINILLLIALLVYVYKNFVGVTLSERQSSILQTIENSQKDLVNASNYLDAALVNYYNTFLILQSWNDSYQKEKIEIVTNKYKFVKKNLEENFASTEILINSVEKKAFIALRRQFILVTASKILKQFLLLEEKEQTVLIEKIIKELGESK